MLLVFAFLFLFFWLLFLFCVFAMNENTMGENGALLSRFVINMLGRENTFWIINIMSRYVMKIMDEPLVNVNTGGWNMPAIWITTVPIRHVLQVCNFNVKWKKWDESRAGFLCLNFDVYKYGGVFRWILLTRPSKHLQIAFWMDLAVWHVCMVSHGLRCRSRGGYKKNDFVG